MAFKSMTNVAGTKDWEEATRNLTIKAYTQDFLETRTRTYAPSSTGEDLEEAQEDAEDLAAHQEARAEPGRNIEARKFFSSLR